MSRSMRRWTEGSYRWAMGAIALVAIAMIWTLSPSAALAARVSTNLVVFYDFEEGAGSTINDSAGGIALDLTIQNPSDVTWGSGFLDFNTGGGNTIATSSGPATKIFDAIQATSALTFEAWIRPQNTSQSGPARIVTVSSGTSRRNFTLGQTGDSFDQRLRTTSTDDNGRPSLSSGGGTVATALQHIVFARTASGDETLYVNGVLANSRTTSGDVSNWDPSYALAIGNEFGNGRTWRGELHLVGIYQSALTSAEVTQNYLAGATAAIPEPGTAVLLGLGLGAMALRRSR